MYAAENPKFSAEIAGKQSFFCFGKYSSELVKKQFGQARCETWGSVALVLCCPCTNVNQGRYRTKSVWRLCTPSACKFSVIFHKNAREYIQYSLRFLFHLTINLTTHLSHNLCAVLPLIVIVYQFYAFLSNGRKFGKNVNFSKSILTFSGNVLK
jgi:hypothetical protein